MSGRDSLDVETADAHSSSHRHVIRQGVVACRNVCKRGHNGVIAIKVVFRRQSSDQDESQATKIKINIFGY